MDSASPRGSKRGVEEVKPSGQKMGGGERPAPTPERDGRADEEVGEGDVAAGRGDLELCKRNEVRMCMIFTSSQVNKNSSSSGT